MITNKKSQFTPFCYSVTCHTIAYNDTARTNHWLLRDEQGRKWLNEEWLLKEEAMWGREGGSEGGEEKWYEMERGEEEEEAEEVVVVGGGHCRKMMSCI